MKIKKERKEYIFSCPTCNKEFIDINYVKSRKFCSHKCIKRIITEDYRKKMSKIAKEKGYGKWMIGRKHPPVSEQTMKKMSIRMKGKRTSINTEFKKGNLHPNYKGGVRIALKRRWQKVRNNPKLKLRQNFSALLCMRLKRRLLKKKGKSTFDFLPYTLEELMKHLENLFTIGMTWENYGKWQIDHKIPDISFDYLSVDDKKFQECWSLNNLQPMWASENYRKGAKMPDIIPPFDK